VPGPGGYETDLQHVKMPVSGNGSFTQWRTTTFFVTTSAMDGGASNV
jgi:hypothetical protein